MPLASVLLDSPVVVVKSISMNVLHLLAIMAEFVLIYHKATDANVRWDILVKIAKKKKLAVKRIPAQHEPCARMRLATATTLAFAEAVTRDKIVM